jgi:hypothetical protein
VIDKALAEDAAKARAEYENVWREDLSDFVPADVVEGCTDWGMHERTPQPGIQYYAYVDCAGGTGTDSFTLGIAHRAGAPPGDRYVLDVVRERKPRFVPAQVIGEYADLLKQYRVSEIKSDKYAIGFHEAEWREHGIRLAACERSTSENYLTTLPLLLAKRVSLLDNAMLRSQLSSLERRVSAGDRETVTHPQHASAHDDVSCAACGVLAGIAKPKYKYDTTLAWVSGPDDDKAAADAAAKAFQAARFAQHILRHSGYRYYWR